MLRSDYLLAYLTYHYGWVASGIVVLLLAVFLGLGFRKALKQKSIFGQMVSLTILCTFTAEILLYIPANLGIWLIAPIALPLPFLWGNGFVYQYGIGRRAALRVPHR